MPAAKRFEGRVAVVTGGASGIGFGIAERMAAEGARIAIWDRDAAAASAAAARLGAMARAYVIDVTDPDAVDEVCAGTVAAHGGIDILIAAAAITGPNLTTWDYPTDAWRQVIDINLNGLFYCNRAVVRVLRERGYGRIVNFASIAGKEGNPNASAYSASKAAVIGLTKSLGKELAKTGVTVNCVTPAAVRTPMFSQMTVEHTEFMLSKIPIGRFGTIAEITALVCWIASEECSFTTGAVFDASGGRATY